MTISQHIYKQVSSEKLKLIENQLIKIIISEQGRLLFN